MNTINVGIIGLGRLGRRYADLISKRVQKAHLIAACSLDLEELAYAKNILKVPHTYTDHQQMIQNKDVDIIFIVTSTHQHASQMIDSLQAGYHVFCEKPLAITLEDCLKVEQEALQHPEQLATVGFVRRHDDGYKYAKQKVLDGAIGKPFLVKSQTVDLDTHNTFQLEFAKTSGGMFHDFNVHDIDLARWFLRSEIKSVYSVGGSYKHPVYAQINDADNVMSICVFENGSIANFIGSRTASSGHDTYTEIVGTEGVLRVGRPNMVTNVEIQDQYGARKECVKTFFDRFERAFQYQIEDFLDCVETGRKPQITLRDATQATRGAIAMTQSLFEGKGVVQLDQSPALELLD